jgi:hypothetical protein
MSTPRRGTVCSRQRRNWDQAEVQMKLGVALPIVDIGGETAVVREFAQAARRSGITGSRHPTTCWAPISRAGPAGAPRSRHQACLPRGVSAAALSGPPGLFLRMEENRGRQAALCDCAEGSATDAHGRVWETWRSPAGERIRSFTIITTKPNKLCAELHNRRVPALATARQYFRHLD